MKIRVGGHSANALLDMIHNRGIELNDHAKRYINDMRYSVSVVSSVVDVKFVTAAELGFEEGGTLKDITAAASRNGLELCPADTAFYLRMALTDQEKTEGEVLTIGDCPQGAITVASRSFCNIAGIHRGFYLRNAVGSLWIRGYECDDGHVWPSVSTFAFAVKDAGL